MPSITVPTALAIGATAVGAGASIYGANKAASAQSNAANLASQTETNAFNQTQGYLAPYRASGAAANGQLTSLTGGGPGGNPLTSYLTKPFTPGDLTQTPGYQFLLDQGEKSVQNGYAARGLGSSGAAIKGGTRYAEDLAGTTYQQQYQNDLTNRETVYNMLMGQNQVGESAAAGTGSAAMGTGQLVGGNQIGAGNAAAGGAVASASALGNLPGNGLLNYMLLTNPNLLGPTAPPNPYGYSVPSDLPGGDINSLINQYAPN